MINISGLIAQLLIWVTVLSYMELSKYCTNFLIAIFHILPKFICQFTQTG